MGADEYEGFPLMYHWRVIPDTGQPLPEELADVDRAVAYWGGASAVCRRIESLQHSTASLVLFLEYIPQNLHDWLGVQIEVGGEATERACATVDDELKAGISFMNARGLLHFDAHFENILSDGRQLFFTDYGLAIASRFDLTQEEADFFRQHLAYDHCYAVTHLVNWLAVAFYGHTPEEREAFVHACAEGVPPKGLPASVEALLVRYAPVAVVMGKFYPASSPSRLSSSSTLPRPALHHPRTHGVLGPQRPVRARLVRDAACRAGRCRRRSRSRCRRRCVALRRKS